MKTISKRDLNQHTAKVLKEVIPDEPAIITERGVPKWRIESLQDGTTTINGMRVTPASDRESWKKITPYKIDESSEAVLAELMADKI